MCTPRKTDDEIDSTQICHRCFSCAVAHKKWLFVFVCDKDRKKWSCTRIFRFPVVLAFFPCTLRSGLNSSKFKYRLIATNSPHYKRMPQFSKNCGNCDHRAQHCTADDSLPTVPKYASTKQIGVSHYDFLPLDGCYIQLLISIRKQSTTGPRK